MQIKLSAFILILLFLDFASAETNVLKSIRFEIEKFQTSDRHFDDPNYSINLIQKINQDIQLSEKIFWSNGNTPQSDLIKVEFIRQITDSSDLIAQEFESGFIRIEASTVLKNKSAESILELINYPQFRLEAFSTLIESTATGNIICEKTSAPTIGQSNYCFYLKKERLADGIFRYKSSNISNSDLKKYNAPVYYRTISETAKQVGPDTIYHVITYVRGPKLSNFQKFFATGAIENTQRKAFQLLK